MSVRLNRLLPVSIEGVGACHLHLRVTTTLRDAQLGARLHDSKAGNLEACILNIGLGDQTLEDRVAEDLPPLSSVRLSALFDGLLKSPAAPVFGPRLTLRLEVRPEAYATAEAESPD